MESTTSFTLSKHSTNWAMYPQANIYPFHPPSPLEAVILWCVSMNLSILVSNTNGIIKYLPSCEQLISLSTVSSRFIQAVTCDRVPFHFSGSMILFFVCRSYLIHPFLCSWHSDFFHLLTPHRACAAVSMSVQMSVQVSAFISLGGVASRRIDRFFICSFAP